MLPAYSRPALIVVAIIGAIFVAVLILRHPRSGQDVTHSSYNRYRVGGVYYLKKAMKISGNFSPADPRTYDVIDFPSVGFTDKNHGDLPAGTRIRFEETIWVPSYKGPGAPVAFGTILDPPFDSHRVNLALLSDYTSGQCARPNTELLAENP